VHLEGGENELAGAEAHVVRHVPAHLLLHHLAVGARHCEFRLHDADAYGHHDQGRKGGRYRNHPSEARRRKDVSVPHLSGLGFRVQVLVTKVFAHRDKLTSHLLLLLTLNPKPTPYTPHVRTRRVRPGYFN
jgi:hypothetical protein